WLGAVLRILGECRPRLRRIRSLNHVVGHGPSSGAIMRAPTATLMILFALPESSVAMSQAGLAAPTRYWGACWCDSTNHSHLSTPREISVKMSALSASPS